LDKAVGISPAIEAFVMVANEGFGFLEELHLADDLLPHLGMLPDEIGLLVSQFSRFSQDLFTDEDLPYIVEERGEFEVSLGFWRKFHGVPHEARVVSYSPGVTRGDTIPGVQGIEQRPNGVEIAAIQVIAVFHEFPSGGARLRGSQLLKVRNHNTVMAANRLIGFELAGVNVVLNSLNGHSQELGRLSGLNEVC
jgi:hypothetical protein